MGITISVVLQKGGVGKSTTSQALASTLGFKKKKVLLIDLDPQTNVTYSSGVDNPKTISQNQLMQQLTIPKNILLQKHQNKRKRNLNTCALI